MSTTTTDDKIRITMSDRRPLSVNKTEWPIIARADWHDGGEHESRANNVRRIFVRENRDGRRIVYGYQAPGNGGQHAGTRNPEGGFLVEPPGSAPFRDAGDGPLGREPDEEETVRAIRRIAGILGDAELADECIAGLPAEDLA